MIGQAKRILELNNLNLYGKANFSCPVISVTSGKGGTGKSFFLLNTAIELSKNNKVLLLDMDVNLGNLHIMLNIQPEKTLYDYFKNQALLEETIYQYSPNLAIIFGETGKTDHPKLDEYSIRGLISRLEVISTEYDFILIDTASGADSYVIALLEKSTSNIIVITPEPTAVMDAYVILKMLKKSNLSNEVYIIINKTPNEEAGKTAFLNLQKAAGHFLSFQIKMLAVLDFSVDAINSIMNQTPLIESNKDSKLNVQISTVAERLIIEKQLANNNHKSKS